MEPVRLKWKDIQAYAGGIRKESLLSDVGSRNQVFKASMPLKNGKATDVAIKVITDPNRKEYFKMEKRLLGQMDHYGIIKLIGYSNDIHEALVYEYVPLRDLRRHIPALDWYKTIAILKGVAQAVVYLHQQEPPVIHRNLSSNNILIDKDWNPKLSGFKASKWGKYGLEQSGAKGSTDPRARLEKPDTRHDVYSFGIMLLEVLTKKTNLVETNDLLKWVEEKKGKLEQIIHTKLWSTGCTDVKGTNAIALANRCTSSGAARPEMHQVLEDLMHLG